MSQDRGNKQNPSSGSTNHPQKKLKVLLVDDEKVVHSLLTDFLTMKGFDLYSAFTISEAKRLIQSETFDIVITDYKMPDGKGTDVVAFVKQKKAGTKILGISANESRETFYAAGADSFVAKPFNMRTFLQTLLSVLNE